MPSEEITKFYDDIYQRKQSQAMRPKQAYVDFLEILPSLKSGKKFLDIACGTGFLLSLASAKGLETHGIDISQQAVSVAKSNSPNSNIQVASAEKLPFQDNFFDYISCLGSIEYFENISQGISEMIRVAKDDAKFLLVVPNQNYFAWKLKKQSGTHQRDIAEELKTLKEWQQLFKDAGLNILAIRHDKWPAKSLPLFYSYNPYKILKRLVFKLIWLILPINYTYQFIILAVKRKNR